MRNLSLERRHLVNAYKVEAGIGVIAVNTVWSMPERLECEVLQKVRYINTLTYLPTYLHLSPENPSFRHVINLNFFLTALTGFYFLFSFWIICSVWNNCSTSVQHSGCTFHDLLTQVLQYSRWSQFNTYDVNQQRYNEAVDSLYHLCSNIEPGT